MIENTCCSSSKQRGCYAQARLFQALRIGLFDRGSLLGANEADLEALVPAGRKGGDEETSRSRGELLEITARRD